MATEFKTVQPEKYYAHFLEHKIRPDGREMVAFRPVCINIGSITSANSSALVKLRDTTVLCGIKAELANPTASEPNCGFIIPNVDLPPLCSSKFRPGPPSEQAQIYSQLILDTIKNSGCILPEDLCIAEGKLCWCLYIDVTCLNYDGNVLDAAVIAIMTAASKTILPNVLISSENGIQITKGTISLKVCSLSFSSTFAIFEDVLIADPTSEEECLASGTVTVFVKEDGSLCGIQKPGGCTVEETKFKHCIQLAKNRTKTLVTLVKEVLSHCKN